MSFYTCAHHNAFGDHTRPISSTLWLKPGPTLTRCNGHLMIVLHSRSSSLSKESLYLPQCIKFLPQQDFFERTKHSISSKVHPESSLKKVGWAEDETNLVAFLRLSWVGGMKKELSTGINCDSLLIEWEGYKGPQNSLYSCTCKVFLRAHQANYAVRQ